MPASPPPHTHTCFAPDQHPTRERLPDSRIRSRQAKNTQFGLLYVWRQEHKRRRETLKRRGGLRVPCPDYIPHTAHRTPHTLVPMCWSICKHSHLALGCMHNTQANNPMQKGLHLVRQCLCQQDLQFDIFCNCPRGRALDLHGEPSLLHRAQGVVSRVVMSSCRGPVPFSLPLLAFFTQAKVRLGRRRRRGALSVLSRLASRAQTSLCRYGSVL